ncbi:hypothetical protein [Flavobacterium sp.]|uniref:hypothetical protein n=1 Tax=Flavobacterium sp. TaxID=239 RepID=UPI0031DEEDE6
MAIQALNTIKKWFQTGLKPSQNQFWDTWDSFRHKLEKVPLEDVEELESILNAKAEKSELDDHKNDNTAHSELFAAKEDKSQKGIALGYAPLDEFSKIAYQYLEIVDNLTSGGTTSMLSAEQGVVLQNQIDSIRTLLSSDNPELDTFQKIADTIEQIQMSLDTILVNDLTTGGTTKALTAEMGKLLQANKEDKSQKGVAGGYVPLNDLAKIASQYLTIINDLTTGGSESILSAEQGIVLQNQIDSINTLLASDNVDLDTIQEIVDAIEQVQMSLDTILVNDLTTGGITKALTAEMGKQLNEIKLTATIATDAETQITTSVTEDNKVVSRSKLFNWWNWLRRLPLIWNNDISTTDYLGQAKSVMNYLGFTIYNTSGTKLFYVNKNGIHFNSNGSASGGITLMDDLNNVNSNLLTLPNKSGTLAICYDAVNTCYGTATKAPLIIPNGTLTTVPQSGAIERDIQGNLYHSTGSTRKKIIDESDAVKYLQTTYRNSKTSNVTNSYSPYSTTMSSFAPSIMNAFGSAETGNYLLKTVDQYEDGYLPVEPGFYLPDNVVFEFYLKGMNCKFGGESKIKMYGIQRTGATSTNLRSYEIPLIITTASDGINSWSILSYEENSYDMKGNIIDTVYRSYPLQTYSYTGYNGNGNLKFNDSIISLDASITFSYEDPYNENGMNAISGSSYTNISTSIIKL